MNKSLTFAAAILASVALAGPAGLGADAAHQHNEFLQFASANNKHYSTTRELYRRERIWKHNKDQVDALNAEANGKATFAMNKFSDMTTAEKASYKGISQTRERESEEKHAGHGLPTGLTGRPPNPKGVGLLGTDINWMDRGHVHPVKDQGWCGSCWAFAAAGVIESRVSIAATEANGGELVAPVRLSEQTGVDCIQGNTCDQGGFHDDYYWFAMEYGVNTEADYPYTGTDDDCAHDDSKPLTWVDDWFDVLDGGGKVADIRAALETGPLSIDVAASSATFENYSSGVITSDMSCPGARRNIDHGIFLVGYEV